MSDQDYPRELIGRPGLAASLTKFLDYMQQHDKVWVARRIDIADHWREHHAADA